MYHNGAVQRVPFFHWLTSKEQRYLSSVATRRNRKAIAFITENLLVHRSSRLMTPSGFFKKKI